MKKMKSILGMAAMMSAMAYYDTPNSNANKRRKIIMKRDSSPKEPIPPKGAKEYFFNIEGEFSTEKMRRDECVFKCFAINDKNAQRKFNKFKSNNTI